MLLVTALTFGLLSVATKPSPRLRSEQQAYYSEALELIRQESWDEALVRMESFAHQYPESSFADNAIYWMGQIYLQKNERALARDEFKRILKLYPNGDRSERADAQIRLLDDRPVNDSQISESQKKESP